MLNKERTRLATARLIEELADLGFARRDLARLLGVTVQAIQKWQKGTVASAENKSRLAGLLAACDLICAEYEIQEIASWFEVPMLVGVPVSPMDLWASERPDLVFDYASGHTDAEETLSRWDPNWRNTFVSDFEVFRASDGKLSLRMRDR